MIYYEIPKETTKKKKKKPKTNKQKTPLENKK